MGHREEFYKDGKLMKVIDTRDINEEKSERICHCKKEARDALSLTDWMVMRKVETGKDLNTNIAKLRSDLKSEIDKIENDLKNIMTLEDYDKYFGYDEFYRILKEMKDM